MAEGQLKRYRIKDKSGNTKDVTYDPDCGLSPQEFLATEIAKFNQEKEVAAKNEELVWGLDEKKQINDSQNQTQFFDEPKFEPAQREDVQEEAPSAPAKKEKSLASIMASKSGISLSSIAAKRTTDAKKDGKKPKGMSRDSYVPNDRLVTIGVKKS